MNTALFITLLIGTAAGCATTSAQPFEPVESKTLWEMTSEDGTMPRDEALNYARRLVLDTKFVNRNEACVVSRSQGDLNQSRASSEEHAIRTLMLAFVGTAENQAHEFGKLQSRIVWWPSADGESCYTLVCIIPPDTARAKTIFSNLPGRRSPLVPQAAPEQAAPAPAIAKAPEASGPVIVQAPPPAAADPVAAPEPPPAPAPQPAARAVAKKTPKPAPEPRGEDTRKRPDPQPQAPRPASKPMVAENTPSPAPPAAPAAQPEDPAPSMIRHEKSVFEAGKGLETFVYGEGATAKLCSTATETIGGGGTKRAKAMSCITAASNIIFALGVERGKEYSYDPKKLLQSTSYRNTRQLDDSTVEAAVCITLPEGYHPPRSLAAN